MFKKIRKYLLITVTTAVIAVLFLVAVCLAIRHDPSLEEKVRKYEEIELRLANMQRTMEVVYNLSPYEARYYSIIFNDFSEKYNLPWEAYPALVRIESNFNSGVMSKMRAKGMTQVLEETGKEQAAKLGITYNDNTLWNCVLNMVIGFNYFSEGYAEKKSLSKEDALKHAMKRYCGGPGYQTINPDAKLYVREYKTSLWDEYLRVSYIYKGIKYDDLMRRDSLNRSKAPSLIIAARTFLRNIGH